MKALVLILTAAIAALALAGAATAVNGVGDRMVGGGWDDPDLLGQGAARLRDPL